MEKHFSYTQLKHILESLGNPDAKYGSKKQIVEQIKQWKTLAPQQKYFMRVPLEELRVHGKCKGKKLDIVNFLLMEHPCIFRALGEKKRKRGKTKWVIN